MSAWILSPEDHAKSTFQIVFMSTWKMQIQLITYIVSPTMFWDRRALKTALEESLSMENEDDNEYEIVQFPHSAQRLAHTGMQGRRKIL